MLLLIPSFCRATDVTLQKIMDQYIFSAITINEGLPHNFINHIYKDSQGFLWLSTHNGLSRYDGYSFVNYNISSTDVTLRANFVNQVCEDQLNRLWIASEAGLDLLDLRSNRLVKIDYSIFKSEDLHQEPVFYILRDDRNAIWLATQTNLYCLSFDNNGRILGCNFLFSTYDKHPIPITSLNLVGGEVIIGYGHHIYKVESSGKSRLLLQRVFDRPIFDAQTQVHGVVKYRGDFWIGTSNGLYRYNPVTHAYKCYRSNDEYTNTLTANNITDLTVISNNTLVVSTLRGLNFYDYSADDFVRLEHSRPVSGRIINNNFINCLYSDGQILWIGTEIGGLNKMVRRHLSLQLFTFDKDDIYSLPDNPVNCIYDDPSGNLWVGNVDNGLSFRKRGSGAFVHFRYDARNPHSLSNNSVSSIISDGRGWLWVATLGGGLNCTTIKGSGSADFTHFTTTNSPLKSNSIGSLCLDIFNGGIWIGSSAGVSFYDLNRHTFTNLALPTDEVPNNILLGMLIDRKKRLWIGTQHGLIVIDLYSFALNRMNVSYRYMKYKLNNPDSRLIEKINCVFEDSNGTIWVGSNGYGLYRLVGEKENRFIFRNYTMKDGLPDNTIYGIVEDRQGRLWLSTNNGLSCYTCYLKNFTNYFESDGLLSDQFYPNAYCRSTDGTLYFGCINGMIGVNDGNQSVVKHAKKVVLTRLFVSNNAVTQGQSRFSKQGISWTKQLYLRESDKSFSVDFSALDFENAENVKYVYRLKNFDETWIECTSGRHFASYTNLRPGHYVFQVKEKNSANKHSGQVTELAIIVSPYFYKTWWFYSLMILLVGIATYYFYQWRIAMYKEQKRVLTEKVKERTLALEEKMDVLSHQNDLLTQQKRQLIDLSKKIQEVTADKISFFTNITHEFRTPITLIMGPVDRALRISHNPKVVEQLNIVQRNCKSLLSLVNQLLDFRKVESGKVIIKKERNNLRTFVRDVLLPFEAYAKDRHIEVISYIHLKNTYYFYDEEWMQKVLVNLLSNAIKFTPNGGKIKFYLYVYINDRGQSQLYLSVLDTGVGILPKDLDLIFDRFYQSRETVKYPMVGQSGTGIGLYVCKRIVNEHGGRIYAVNNRCLGASFRLLMPLDPADEQPSTLPLFVPPQSLSLKPTKESAPLQPTVELSSACVPEKSDKVSSKLTILIVDDNPDMRLYIRSILSAEYNVVEAGDGEQALELLKAVPVDFIISDLMMPVMDGIELSRRIKSDFSISHIPILILTAKVSEEVRIDSFRIGVDEYIQKPFSEELLLVRIYNILNNRKNSQKRFALHMDPQLLEINEESCDNKFFKNVMQVVELCYKDSDFDVNIFAGKMCISKTLLNQKLQGVVGQSTAKFIGNYRLQKAYELILINKQTKNMNISEIAYEVGFNDPKYFTRCFQKKFGVLPSTI